MKKPYIEITANILSSMTGIRINVVKIFHILK